MPIVVSLVPTQYITLQNDNYDANVADGGEAGIRTLGAQKDTLDFESSPFDQLWHLSMSEIVACLKRSSAQLLCSVCTSRPGLFRRVDVTAVDTMCVYTRTASIEQKATSTA